MPADTSRPALSRSPLLAGITPDDLKALVRQAQQRSFRLGQALFRRGDAADGLYAVVAGEVRVVIEGREGNEITLATFGPGEVLGELSVLDGRARSASAIAVAGVDTLFVAAESFLSWLSAHPVAATLMLRELARRLRTTDEQVAEVALLSVEERLVRRLWQCFVERSGARAPAVGSRLRMSQSELASTLGVTRESVNKHFARLKAGGVLAVDAGSIVLLRPDALRAGTDAL